MKIKSITVAMAITILSGCAALEKNTVSEKSLQEKASLSIGTDPENIKVSNIQGSLEKITFDATANGSQYSCYYTTVVIVKSDALCTKFDGDKKVSQCDALSSAAGNC